MSESPHLSQSSSQDEVQVGPHDFAPMRFWDNRENGRCKHCTLPRWKHILKRTPNRLHITGWAPARPYGDRSAAKDASGIIYRTGDKQ